MSLGWIPAFHYLLGHFLYMNTSEQLEKTENTHCTPQCMNHSTALFLKSEKKRYNLRKYNWLAQCLLTYLEVCVKDSVGGRVLKIVGWHSGLK